MHVLTALIVSAQIPLTVAFATSELRLSRSFFSFGASSLSVSYSSWTTAVSSRLVYETHEAETPMQNARTLEQKLIIQADQRVLKAIHNRSRPCYSPCAWTHTLCFMIARTWPVVLAWFGLNWPESRTPMWSVVFLSFLRLRALYKHENDRECFQNCCFLLFMWRKN